MEDPINMIDTEGTSAADIQKIKDAFKKAVQDMVDKGLRRPGEGYLNGLANNGANNVYRLTGGNFGSHYYGCGDQSEYLLDELNKLQLDDKWDFQKSHSAWHPHYFDEATSSNSSDSHLTLDPWKGTLEEN